jgi:hypothetical protein
MNKKFELLTRWTNIAVTSTHICKYCSEEFALYDLEKEALDREGFCYPDFCPTCRFRMLYSYINDKHLYHRKDDLSDTRIISSITPEFDGKVYKAEEYKKMILDDFGLTFGRDIGKDIFEDFRNLYQEFPKPSKLIYPALENAEFAGHLWWAKNIYMSFCIFDGEDIYYSQNVLFECRNIFSSYDVSKSENIYESGLIHSSYEIAYSYNIFDSSFLLFCRNMQNCQNCIFCSNQVNAQYRIYNEQYTKEEYEKIEKTIREKLNEPHGYRAIKNEFDIFLSKHLMESSTLSIDSETTTGERVYNSKNCVNIHAVPKSLEDSINIIETGGGKRLINSVASWLNGENIVGACSAWINSSWVYFCYATVENCHNIYYSSDIESCEECMFSVGLKGKKYCILNKEYKKEEFFVLKDSIISKLKKNGTWWQFLGFDFSPFPYNDTLAYDYFKVNRVISVDGEVKIIDKNAIWTVRLSEDTFIADAELDLGWAVKIPIKWRTKDKEVNIPEWVSVIPASELTSKMSEEIILDRAILCEKSGRPFKIQRAELEYLRKRWFPLPTIHPELRIDVLVSKRPLWQLFLWKSDISWEDILSVFREKPEFKLYSKEEYQDLMFS